MTLHSPSDVGRLPPPVRIDPGVPGVFHRGTHGRRVGHRRSVWSFRERRLGARLDREVQGCGVVLHSRRGEPGLDCEPIDHLLVSSAGVWVIRADHSIERLTPVAATSLISECGREASRQVAATRSVLSAIGFDWLDVHLAVCATNAESVLRRPLRVGDFWVARRSGLLSLIRRPGPLTHSDVATVAAELSRRFPAAR